jgi:hypothetical protein
MPALKGQYQLLDAYRFNGSKLEKKSVASCLVLNLDNSLQDK